MRQLLTVLIDSFVIGSRNFTLVYIFLFSLLLLESLMSLGGYPQLTWQWGLYSLIILLLFAATMAGWFNMVAQACVRFLDKPRTEALKQSYVKESFKLLGDFLPGISQFFAPSAVVYGLHTALVLLFGWLTRDLWKQNLGLLTQAANLSPDQRPDFMAGLTFSQQASLGELSLMILAGVVFFGVLSLLFMLWPTFVVFYRKGGLQACLDSMLQFFRDPLKLLAIVLLVMLIQVPLFLLSGFVGASHLLLGMLLQLLSLLVEVFFTIILFVYAYHVIGKPLPEPSISETGKPAETPPNQ